MSEDPLEADLPLPTIAGFEAFDVHLLRLPEEGDPVVALAAVFGLSEAMAQGIVDKTPLIVKSGVNRETADVYHKALREIGAVVEIRPSAELPLPTPVRMRSVAPASVDEFDIGDLPEGFELEADFGLDAADLAFAPPPPPGALLASTLKLDSLGTAPPPASSQPPTPSSSSLPAVLAAPSDAGAPGLNELELSDFGESSDAEVADIAPSLPPPPSGGPVLRPAAPIGPLKSVSAAPASERGGGRNTVFEESDHPGFWRRLSTSLIVPVLGSGVIWFFLFAGYAVLFGLITQAYCYGLIVLPFLGLLITGTTAEYFLAGAEAGQRDDGDGIPRIPFRLPDTTRLLTVGLAILVAMILLAAPAVYLQFSGFDQWVVVAAGFLPSFYLPMGIAIAALSGYALQLFNVVAVFRAIAKSGVKYLVVVILGWALVNIGQYSAQQLSTTALEAMTGQVMDRMGIEQNEEEPESELVFEDSESSITEGLDQRYLDPNFQPSNSAEREEMERQRLELTQRYRNQRVREVAPEERQAPTVTADKPNVAKGIFLLILAALIYFFAFTYSIGVQGYLLGCIIGERPEEFDWSSL